MAPQPAAHRTYKGWDIFYERNRSGLHWTARKQDGDVGLKFRADTLKGAKRAIDNAKWLED